ncbi:hypothetical protein H8E52_05660 [bacterium]|nr:hypothetical protein [bacterium]
MSLPTGQTTPAYLILHTTGFEIGVVAAAFRVENWPESVGFPWGVALVDWVGDTISSGSIEEGITILPVGDSIPWVPDENGNILIATIYFTVLDPDWIGAETILSINDDLHDHFDEPVFLSDVDYHIYGMLGDSIFLHTDLWLATATTTFSELKALY